MSEVTLTTSETGTIYGDLAAAKAYIATKYGETYAAWRALAGDDDDRKRTLATAAALLDAQVWQDDYDTFAERDAVTAFRNASYELAVAILADSSLVQAADQGSNIKSVAAGGASVEYFNSTTQNAAPLPAVAMRLVGQYLSALRRTGPVAGGGQSGSCVNPFSQCEDLDRTEPY